MSKKRTVWERAWGRWQRHLWRATARDAITGALDVPEPGQRFVHGFNLRGWVAGEGDAVVAAYLAGRKVWEGRPVRPRPDVSPDAREFEVFVPAGALTTSRVVGLKVTARRRGAPDTHAVTLHALPLIRGAGGATLPRWAYGRVWDRDAADASDAMNAVAGYDDRTEWERSGLATADHVASAVGLTPDDRVLEVGCGAGRIGRHLASRCAHWTGADVSRNWLRFAATELSAHPNVGFVHLNGFDLAGVADVSQYVVYCSAVFMHLDEWDRYRYVSEFHRVLRPGGRVYFDNFDLRSPQGWELFLRMSALDVAVRPPNVSKASTEQELTWYAERAGFEGITSTTGSLWVTVVAARPSTTPV